MNTRHSEVQGKFQQGAGQQAQLLHSRPSVLPSLLKPAGRVRQITAKAKCDRVCGRQPEQDLNFGTGWDLRHLSGQGAKINSNFELGPFSFCTRLKTMAATKENP